MFQKNRHPRHPSRNIRAGKVPVRLVIFLAIIVSPFAYFGYIFASEALTGGIEHHGDFDAVDLKALGFYAFDAQNGTLSDVPEKWRALDGKRVMLEGFMYAGQSAEDRVADFQFVYNRQICCFGAAPQVQERVFVHVPGNGTVPYCDPMCRVWGTLHVNVERQERGGVVTCVYTMDEDRIETAEHNGWIIPAGVGAAILLGVGVVKFTASHG
jgi:hypothetical protein